MDESPTVRMANYARDAAIRASTDATGELARRYDLNPSSVSRIRSGAPRRLTRRERFAEVVAGAWRADCMDDEEWGHWLATNPTSLVDTDLAERPCRDCPMGFAAEMRAIGKCNGTPGWRPPVDDIEEAAVGDAVTATNVQVNAPCERCDHERVCGIKASLVSLRGGVDVAMPKPDPAITVSVALEVDCSEFKKRPGAKRVQSAAQLAASIAAAARMREIRMGRRAERAGQPAAVPA